MASGFYNVPNIENEPVKEYLPGSQELKDLMSTYQSMNLDFVDIPMLINGEEVRTGKTVAINPPHDFKRTVGQYHEAEEKHVIQAISSCLEAKALWAKTPWEHRAAIFLKAAELLAGPYRAKMNATTMIGQSKNVHQAEIDSACEMIDFFRFNAQFMVEIYKNQPKSSKGVWNRMEYRPLEGFTYAVTPFNFTAIAANLPTSMVMMGNVCVWKPSNSQIYSANVIIELLKEAGLPDGVINVVYGDPVMISNTILANPNFSGLHFTGSTEVFRALWEQVGKNIGNYKSYPRIVGETGGKDFIWAHPSADSKQVATAISRGAFEYQGQKCSAASRAYIPKSLWSDIKDYIISDIKSMKLGRPFITGHFINAVIHEDSFDKISQYIAYAKKDKEAQIIVGGKCDKTKGYFIEPTVILTSNPKYKTMHTELFGPVITIYVYEDKDWKETLRLVDETSEYALTGAIFSKDRYVIDYVEDALRNAAGNFYINDKPTGAVVGQQPFGGSRSSGTNDKAGSIWNLLRWVSPRTIKETFVSPTDYRYPFLNNN
ncbi:L-glutamate gamma-semialdehyde dehydrogenase [Aestuariivivens sediminis]|uniref:L-glutamate gamma-semialdehyde dehydrogenase n=1 Tax=Aestuariivivens sediminis TaxID=2913557 RepID=UPI001F56770F|nr:L-glutamate gamma-semialdehyde dehydrogenase [Aestuariivivens sediminis]